MTTQAPENMPTADSGLLCGDQIRTFAADVLTPHAIEVPTIKVGTTSLSRYMDDTVTLVFSACESASGVAHELGHYVHHRSMAWSLPAMVQDASGSFCPGGAGSNSRCINGWVKGAEMYPGIEHAAHCIGNVLWAAGPYTKCPSSALLSRARARVTRP